MNMNLTFVSFLGTAFGFLILYFIVRKASVVVYPHQSNMILAWGKCVDVLEKPGFYFRAGLLLPWQRVINISRQLDYRIFKDIQVNDVNGTTMQLDFWLEYRVMNAQKSVFAVESWEDSLRHLVSHVLMTQSGSVRMEDLLTKREQFTSEALHEIREASKEWGIRVEAAHIQDIRLLPEISRQLFNRVAAKIEMKKADLEEQGRIAIQTLKAETQLKVADLQAQAKAMHPLAVGKAYHRIAENPAVLAGFQELHQLSLVQPGRAVSFVGFETQEIRAMDAMMIPYEASENKYKISSELSMQ